MREQVSSVFLMCYKLSEKSSNSDCCRIRILIYNVYVMKKMSFDVLDGVS